MRKLALVSCVAAVSVSGTLALDAATSAGSKTSSRHAGALRRAIMRHVVHADLVVARRDGTFPTVTVDRGRIATVDGSAISLQEGTAKATYKTVDITLPAGAVVRINGHAATVADLKPGMRAGIVQAPRRTVVRAHAIRR